MRITDASSTRSSALPPAISTCSGRWQRAAQRTTPGRPARVAEPMAGRTRARSPVVLSVAPPVTRVSGRSAARPQAYAEPNAAQRERPASTTAPATRSARPSAPRAHSARTRALLVAVPSTRRGSVRTRGPGGHASRLRVNVAALGSAVARPAPTAPAVRAHLTSTRFRSSRSDRTCARRRPVASKKVAMA